MKFNKDLALKNGAEKVKNGKLFWGWLLPMKDGYPKNGIENYNNFLENMFLLSEYMPDGFIRRKDLFNFIGKSKKDKKRLKTERRTRAAKSTGSVHPK